MNDRPYDWADDDVFAASPTETPGVYTTISDSTRRGLWNEQSRRILDEAIELARVGEQDKALEMISVFVIRFNRRYGSTHSLDELRLP